MSRARRSIRLSGVVSRSAFGSTVALAMILVLGACQPAPAGTAGPAGSRPAGDISDQNHGGGTPGFSFLPPLVKESVPGLPVAGLEPVVTVEELAPGTRGTIATFTTSSGLKPVVDGYVAIWDTRAAALDPSRTYRIHVTLQGFELGFADVDVVASGNELRTVATNEYVPLLANHILPIKFRIEQDALRCVGVTCTAVDQCHVAGVCDVFTGACSNPRKADGVACDDGSACTSSDTCQAGACVPGTPRVCMAADQCHDTGVCDPATGECSNPAKPDGSGCSDGDACTTVDTCKAGACTGSTPVVCTAIDACHVAGTCDPTTGMCSVPAAADGTACSDGDACTLGDACHAGVCTASSSVACAAIDQCHAAGTCSPATGTCSTPPVADGSACNDGNACTQADSCQAGVCSGASPVTCRPLDQCHLAGTCDPTTGQCSNPIMPNGNYCDDRNLCTLSSSCQEGACVGSNPRECTAAGPCRLPGVCEPATGVCSFAAMEDGSACSDGNACTRSDQCVSGSCRGSDPVVCTALDACHTAGVCNPTTGACSNPTARDYTLCDDGNACTRSSYCASGSCIGASPVTCAAPAQCKSAGVCDPATGSCAYANAPEGTACNDGNTCTSDDVCVTGICRGTPARTSIFLDPGVTRYTDGTDPTALLYTGACSTPRWTGPYVQSGEPGVNYCGPTAAMNLMEWYGQPRSYSTFASEMNTNNWETDVDTYAICIAACVAVLGDPLVCPAVLFAAVREMFNVGTLPADFEKSLKLHEHPGYRLRSGVGPMTQEQLTSLVRAGSPVAVLVWTGATLHWTVVTGLGYDKDWNFRVFFANDVNRSWEEFLAAWSLQGILSDALKGWAIQQVGMKGYIWHYYEHVGFPARSDAVTQMSPGSGFWGDWTQTLYCPTGSFATGYQMQSWLPIITFDPDGLEAIKLFCPGGIVLPHDGSVGAWLNVATCPAGEVLVGASMLMQPPQGSGDDTAANSIKFQCSDGTVIQAASTSNAGEWGAWSYCPEGTAICGMSERIEAPQGSGDDTALNGAIFTCCSR